MVIKIENNEIRKILNSYFAQKILLSSSKNVQCTHILKEMLADTLTVSKIIFVFFDFSLALK